MLYFVLIISTVAKCVLNIANILVALDDPRPGVFLFRARTVKIYLHVEVPPVGPRRANLV